MPTLDEQFEAAVWIIKTLPKNGPIQISINDQLHMYSLFKQATIGPCNTEQPYFFKIEERLKWNAWSELGQMAKDEAKARYVQKMMELCDTAENEHDLLSYIQDPSVVSLVSKQAEIREKFALLGRTNIKGHEGETIKVHGISVTL